MTKTKSNDKDDSRQQGKRRRWTPLDAFCLLVAVMPLLLMPLVVASAIHSWRHNNNDIITWADDSLPVKQEFQAFADQFGRPELVVVSWPGCTVDSVQLEQLAGALEADSASQWFTNVVTPASLVDKIRQAPGSLRESAIKAQLRGLLIGQDAKTACLNVELGDMGRQKRPQAIQRIKDLGSQFGLSNDEMKIGGIGAELAWMDEDSVTGPARILPFVGILSAVLCVVLLRSLRIGLFVSFLGAFTGILSAALIEWCGVQSNAIIATLPTLGGLLAISLSLHFLAYHRSAAAHVSDPRQALRQAYKWAFQPTVISATTTALGLCSLLLSRTLTIRQFGAFGAMTTVCAAILVLTVLPAFLRLTNLKCGNGKGRLSQNAWAMWHSFISAFARSIVIVVVLIMIVFATGFSRLSTGIDVENLFVPTHEIIRSDRWLESHIGPLKSVEVVVAFPKEITQPGGLDSDELVKQLVPVQSLTRHLRSTKQFNCVASAATGLPNMKNLKGIRGVIARTKLRRWISGHKGELTTSGFLSESASERLWRISVRVPSTDNGKVSLLCSQLEREVDTFLRAYKTPKGNNLLNVKHSVTGLPLLLEQIEQQFIEDLLFTYLGGLGLITLAVFFVLRSIPDALIAMIPNVFPAVIVLGGLSLANVVLDVGSIMTASIALGVAVDDTLHFVLWYRQQQKLGKTLSESVESSIIHCGSPILHTSIICGLGMALLAMAPFLPTVRFGSLIAAMLAVALVGDLLFLPAMLTLRGQANRVQTSCIS